MAQVALALHRVLLARQLLMVVAGAAVPGAALVGLAVLAAAAPGAALMVFPGLTGQLTRVVVVVEQRRLLEQLTRVESVVPAW